MILEAGIAYERGEVGAKDLVRAEMLYKQGCKAKQPDLRGRAHAARLVRGNK